MLESVKGRKLMTLYHQTSPEACQGILAEGFRIGHGGWCGDAIYFALSPEATKTKAITPHSGIGCMLEVAVLAHLNWAISFKEKALKVNRNVIFYKRTRYNSSYTEG